MGDNGADPPPASSPASLYLNQRGMHKQRQRRSKSQQTTPGGDRDDEPPTELDPPASTKEGELPAHATKPRSIASSGG